MTRLSSRFAKLHSCGERALIAYMMAGYPTRGSTIKILRGLIEGGADVIELGFPFSDPLADGPVIQDAATESLRRKTDMAWFLTLVRQLRQETDIPLVLMTYTNILYGRGYDAFIADAVDAGIDGFIIPDMSIEESREYTRAARNAGADTIFLVSPNTDSDRLSKIARISTGFLYMVAVYGTTGVRDGVPPYAIRAVRAAKRHLKDSIPVAVGFGVSTPADVKKYVSAGADAVVVGSAILKLAAGAPPGQLQMRVAAFVRRLKRQTLQDAR